MPDWRDTIDGLTLKGQIAVPYTWWVGEVGSRFLRSLRDEKKILGNRCAGCGRVFVPPRKNCGRCFIPVDEWSVLGDEGTVETYTVVRYPFTLQPLGPPFAYALIKLDGADVSFLHLVKGRLEALRKGARVKVRFREKREGHILDIEYFEIME
jgi:uncharacterized OB-fold protein